MKVTKLSLSDVLKIEPRSFGDARGFFLESYNRHAFFQATGLDVEFVQDNHSKSAGNVLRGLHDQLAPKAQGKLVRVVAGAVFDVAVDIRAGSPTFGKWVSETLSAENKVQLWIPPGFAHGFLVLGESAEVIYKTTDYYAPDYERGIRWDDPDLAINWPLLEGEQPVLSAKDAVAPFLRELFPLTPGL